MTDCKEPFCSGVENEKKDAKEKWKWRRKEKIGKIHKNSQEAIVIQACSYVFDLVVNPTKYYENISKHKGDMACTVSIPKKLFRGDNYKKEKSEAFHSCTQHVKST